MQVADQNGSASDVLPYVNDEIAPLDWLEVRGCRGGSKISGKGVHMYKGDRVRFADSLKVRGVRFADCIKVRRVHFAAFISFFLNIP